MAFTPIMATGDAKSGKHFLIGFQGTEKGDPFYIAGLQEDSKLTRGGDLLDEKSKQGRILQVGTHEDKISLDKYLSDKDPLYDALIYWKENDKQFKMWQTDIAAGEADPKPKEGEEQEGDTIRQYPSDFAFVYSGDLELSAPKNGLAELSIEGQVIGQIKHGKMPLSDATVNFARTQSEYQNPGDTTGEYPGVGGATTTTTTTTTKP